MSTRGVELADVSFTDGQTAAWGGALSTAMTLAPARRLAGSRLAAIEVLSPAVIAQCLARGEHPLRRLVALRERLGTVPLRATLNLLVDAGHRGCDVLPAEVLAIWLHTLAAGGVSQLVLVDPLLDLPRMEGALKAARSARLDAIAALPFAADAGRRDEWYAEHARSLAFAGAARVMLRDESGVLDPERAATLIPALRDALGTTPLDLHSRCQTALGPRVVLEAARLGVARIDTVLPALANGASAPSLPLLVRSAGLLGIELDAPDRDLIADADALLRAVAEQQALATNLPWAFDLAPYAHQLPGELAAEFMARLREQRRWADLHAFSAECARVRREMGAPPMLAPFARPIAEQAWLHLQGAPRYASLLPGLRRLLQGAFGTTPEAPDRALRQRVGRLDTARTTSVAELRAAAPDRDEADAVLALLAGIEPAALPARGAAGPPHVPVTPHEALTMGILQRATGYAVLSVQGPQLRLRFENLAG